MVFGWCAFLRCIYRWCIFGRFIYRLCVYRWCVSRDVCAFRVGFYRISSLFIACAYTPSDNNEDNECYNCKYYQHRCGYYEPPEEIHKESAYAPNCRHKSITYLLPVSTMDFRDLRELFNLPDFQCQVAVIYLVLPVVQSRCERFDLVSHFT